MDVDEYDPDEVNYDAVATSDSAEFPDNCTNCFGWIVYKPYEGIYVHGDTGLVACPG